MGGEHEDCQDMIDVGLDESSGSEGECLFTGLLMFDMKSTSTHMNHAGAPGSIIPKILCIIVAEALYFRD
jgi:hypothetical protein